MLGRMTASTGRRSPWGGWAWLAACVLVGEAGFAQEADVHRVELVLLESRRLDSVLKGFGSLEPFRRVTVSAEGQGQIASMPVDEGGWVKAGNILFAMDRRADEIALALAEAERQRAELEFEKLKAGSRPEEIEEARRRLAAAAAVMKAAKDDWDRVKKLAEQGIAATSELVRARSEYDVSAAQQFQAQARLALVEEGSRSEELAIAQANVTIQNAKVDDIQLRLEKLTSVAPFEGVVTKRLKEVGEWATPGSMVLEMMVMNPMKLRIPIPQKHVPFIQPGQEARVSIPGLESMDLRGQVVALIPRASEGSRNFPVILELDNRSRKLAAGMYAKVSLVLDDGVDALVLPRTALQYRNQQMVVYRFQAESDRRQGRVEEIPVTIGRELKGAVTIEARSGFRVSAGDSVVHMGGSRLKDGDPVRVLPRQESNQAIESFD